MVKKLLQVTTLVSLTLASSALAEGDGECKKCKKMTPEKKAAFLEKYDTDGDGELSEDEKAVAKAARKEKKKSEDAAL